MSERTSFVDALKAKYCDDDEENNGCENFVQITVFGNSKLRRPRSNSAGDNGGQVTGGDGGEESAPELAYLKNVVLYNSGISHASIPSSGLSSLCPNVLDLDLSSNVLQSWSEVLTILKHLPHLKFVNLSSNPLGDLEISSNEDITCSIQDLVLNDTKVSWSEVAALSRLMPKLQQLHLCMNDYNGITLSAEEFLTNLPNLHMLALNNNHIKRWDEISKLKLLPQLHTLVLLENPLEDVYYKQTHSASFKGDDSAKMEEMSGGSKCEGGCFHGNSRNNKSDSPEESRSNSQGHPGCDVMKRVSDGSGEADGTVNSSVSAGSAEEVSKPTGNMSTSAKQQSTPKEMEQADAIFMALESLCITGTALSDWQHLQELGHFPRLHSVKMKHIPLLVSWEEADRRKLAIACLPRIKHLNGSDVTPEEREKSERHFVRLFIDHGEPPQRHEELVKKYGKLKPLYQLDLGRGFKEFAKLSFIYEGRCIQQEAIRVVETVCKLKEYCAKLIKKKPWMLKLYLKTQDPDTDQTVMEELFLDSLPLSRFDMKDGDEIHIDVDMGAKNNLCPWQPGIQMAP